MLQCILRGGVKFTEDIRANTQKKKRSSFFFTFVVTLLGGFIFTCVVNLLFSNC